MKESFSKSQYGTQVKQCDMFCFQQCSDKYEELIVKREHGVQSGDLPKVSLKKTHEQSKNNCITKLLINQRSQSQKQLYQPQRWRTSTNRSKQDKNSNRHDIQLFKKKNKVETQIQDLHKQMQKLSLKYQQRLATLLQIKEEIKDRKTLKNNKQADCNDTRLTRQNNTRQTHQNRGKVVSVFQSTRK